MKRITMTAAVIVTVMTTAFASSDGAKKQRAAIIPGDNVTYKVLYDSNEPTVVRIKIKDENGDVLRTDRIKTTDGFMQRYDLNKLKEGTYVVELKDKHGVITEKIEITTNDRNQLRAIAKN